MDRLKTTHFECPKCSATQVVEALGVVVSPPKCHRCKIKMKQVEHSRPCAKA